MSQYRGVFIATCTAILEILRGGVAWLGGASVGLNFSQECARSARSSLRPGTARSAAALQFRVLPLCPSVYTAPCASRIARQGYKLVTTAASHLIKIRLPSPASPAQALKEHQRVLERMRRKRSNVIPNRNKLKVANHLLFFRPTVTNLEFSYDS